MLVITAPSGCSYALISLLISAVLNGAKYQHCHSITLFFLDFFAVTMSASDYVYLFDNQAMLALIAVTFGVTKATHSW